MRIEIEQEQAEDLLRYKGKDLLFGDYDFAKIIDVEFEKKKDRKGNIKKIFLIKCSVESVMYEEEKMGYYRESFIEEHFAKKSKYKIYDLWTARKHYLKFQKSLEIFRRVNLIAPTGSFP